MIVRATHRIGFHILHSKTLIIAGVVAFILTALKVHFVLVLLTVGLWQMFQVKGRPYIATTLTIIVTFLSLLYTNFGHINLTISIVNESGLFIEGLKAGLLSFGGAYTAIPFLHNSMVDVYPNITSQSFLDGIALGNIIPAPLGGVDI